jgi:hypothetical protein
VESEDNHFHALCKAVSELCDKIPVPEPLSAFRYALSHGLRDDEAEEPSEPKPTQVKVSTDVYKYRSSRKERAFVPGLLTMSQPAVDFLSLDMGTATTFNRVTLDSCTRNLVDELVDVEEEGESNGTQIKYKRPEFHYQPLRLKETVPNPKKIRKKELLRMRK